MKNIQLFEEFSAEKLFEDRIESIRMKAGVNSLEWAAMRANPESAAEKKKHAKYLGGELSKQFVEKVAQVVCDIFGDGKNMKTFLIRLAAAESCYGTNPNT